MLVILGLPARSVKSHRQKAACPLSDGSESGHMPGWCVATGGLSRQHRPQPLDLGQEALLGDLWFAALLGEQWKRLTGSGIFHIPRE